MRMRALVLTAVFALCGFAAAGAEDVPPAYSPSVEANGVVYVAGHLPLVGETAELDGADIATQTRRTVANIAETLAARGLTLADVVNVTVYLTSMEDFAAFNETYAALMPQPYPARATVAVSALALGSRIEMSCVAVRSDEP